MLLCRKDRGIRELKDLSGKAIGCCGGGLETVYRQLLQEQGLSDITLRRLNMGLVQALISGELDATFDAYWNIEAEQLSHLGIETISLSLEELGIPNYPELIFLANSNKLKKHPDLAARFRAALHEAKLFSRHNPSEAFVSYRQSNPLKTAETLAWEEKAWEKTYPLLSENDELDPESWQNFAEWMRQSGARNTPGHSLHRSELEVQNAKRQRSFGPGEVVAL